jgi:hypothetical protein
VTNSRQPVPAGTKKTLLEGVLTAHRSPRGSGLAGVSVEYYAQLERGNLAGASDSVLDARARDFWRDWERIAADTVAMMRTSINLPASAPQPACG